MAYAIPGVFLAAKTVNLSTSIFLSTQSIEYDQWLSLPKDEEDEKDQDLARALDQVEHEAHAAKQKDDGMELLGKWAQEAIARRKHNQQNPRE